MCIQMYIYIYVYMMSYMCYICNMHAYRNNCLGKIYARNADRAFVVVPSSSSCKRMEIKPWRSLKHNILPM